jgi:hypothetical protein
MEVAKLHSPNLLPVLELDYRNGNPGMSAALLDIQDVPTTEMRPVLLVP